MSLLALVNKNMPRTFGDTVIHTSHCDAIVEHDFELPELKVGTPSEQETKIGKFIAETLIDDGATLQMGKAFAFSYLALPEQCFSPLQVSEAFRTQLWPR